MPKSKRPPLMWSRVAISSAIRTGFRSGSTWDREPDFYPLGPGRHGAGHSYGRGENGTVGVEMILGQPNRLGAELLRRIHQGE